jgi:cobalamin biosynthesis protein CbiG
MVMMTLDYCGLLSTAPRTVASAERNSSIAICPGAQLLWPIANVATKPYTLTMMCDNERRLSDRRQLDRTSGAVGLAAERACPRPRDAEQIRRRVDGAALKPDRPA